MNRNKTLMAYRKGDIPLLEAPPNSVFWALCMMLSGNITGVYAEKYGNVVFLVFREQDGKTYVKNYHSKDPWKRFADNHVEFLIDAWSLYGFSGWHGPVSYEMEFRDISIGDIVAIKKHLHASGYSAKITSYDKNTFMVDNRQFDQYVFSRHDGCPTKKSNWRAHYIGKTPPPKTWNKGETMTTKLVKITRCADCPLDRCELRLMCGGIPLRCPLPDAEPKPDTRKYDAQHQLRNYSEE